MVVKSFVAQYFRNIWPIDIFWGRIPRSVKQKQIQVNIIGPRHGEKLYETQVNREEMAKAHDLSNYYSVPADTRDLKKNTAR